MGNPQNLYIFSYYGLKPLQFFSSIIPLVLFGVIALILFIYRLKNKKLKLELSKININNPSAALIWGIIFSITVASVFGIISYLLALIVTFTAVLILNRKLLLKIDYRLLITFVCFFIFIGNFSNSVIVQNLLQQFLKNSSSVFTSSIIISQFISNVPASILLSHFTMDWKPLLWGVNIGGLGTIIASLASVISYKLFIEENPEQSKNYLKRFSIITFLFLS
jgi:Na+/H+ antiporter NhaD/arsenite permease-like protein